jgi:hypothetical protein
MKKLAYACAYACAWGKWRWEGEGEERESRPDGSGRERTMGSCLVKVGNLGMERSDEAETGA